MKPSKPIEIVSDALIVIGCCAITYCAHLISPPSAWGVGGVLSILLGWTLGRGAR